MDSYVTSFDEALAIFEKSSPSAAIRIRDNDYAVDDDGGTREEVDAWYASQDLDTVDIVYVYGVGVGYHYTVLLPWLRAHSQRQLVFLEPSLGALKRLLLTELGFALVSDRQVHLYHSDEDDDGNMTVGMITSLFLFMKPVVTSLGWYKKSEKYQRISSLIMHDSYNKDGIVAELASSGRAFFLNFYKNIRKLSASHRITPFYGAFSGIPAVICGAGPSLEKHFDLLKTLKDRALIVAGGSAMNALNSAGILPHFGGGVDPNDMQYDRIIHNSAVGVPYFYRSRMNHKALAAIDGPTIYVTGSGGYAITEWFEKKVGIEDDVTFNEGYNIIHLLTEIMRALGCDPIIFVGMDLGYTASKSYAPGIVDDVSVDMEELQNDVFDGDIITVTDIDGRPLTTNQKWINESLWMSQYAKKCDDLSLYNATEGGLGFEGIANLSFRDAIETHMTQKHDIKKIIADCLSKGCMPENTKDSVEEGLVEIQESLVRTIELLEMLHSENEKVKAKAGRGEYVAPEMQTGRGALCEADLREEVAYNYILKTMALAVTMMEQRRYRALDGIFDDKERLLASLTLNGEKIAFLKKLAESNLALLIQSSMI